MSGHALLAERIARLPSLLRAAAGDDPLALRPPRRLTATGVGSSEAHARLLVHLAVEQAGLPARFLPLSAFAAPLPPAPDDLLVVFSQGVSPNARLALATAAAWGEVVLATAATVAPGTGVRVVRFAGEDEYGTLLRVTGPMAGYLAALRIARALTPDPGSVPALDVERIAEHVERAGARALSPPPAPLVDPVLVTSGAYGDLVRNLQYKLMEGLLIPMPPAWDVLHVAHGPFQERCDRPTTWLVLARADAPGEADLVARLEAMLPRDRHRLLRLTATLPGPLALFEHEAQLNALVLREIADRGIDQAAWPGRGRDAPLYGLAEPPAAPLAAHTWPEVAAAVGDGRRTVVVALGSTEQHGPHLPLDTDTRIAEALAARVAGRVPGAVVGPTLAVGCASEHLDFPGTLHCTPATLASLLADVLGSLARHGFTAAFVFSAHGGNVGALRDALPALRLAAAPMRVVAHGDLDEVTAALHAAAADGGVTAEAAGHHAGEIETSILLAIRPAAVRPGRAAGRLAPTAGAQSLFYPSLRREAPDGTVGDPRAADAARGERYLAAWTDVLVDAWERATNSPHAKGTQNA